MNEIRTLAAILFAEAAASVRGPTEEMRAVAWTVRNRWLHVQTSHGKRDQKWFGRGDTIRSIIEHGKEFHGAKTDRYRLFPTDASTLRDPGDRQFALDCLVVAEEVLRKPPPAVPGRDGKYPYVWFQKGKAEPSPRATKNPVFLGKHHFWSFAEGGERG